MKKERPDPSKSLNERVKTNSAPRYHLRLYVTGATPRSLQAIESLKQLCEEHLKGRYELAIVDMYQQPELARKEQILAAPTLIKLLPPPLRRLIGDMTQTDRVLAGLDLQVRR